METAQYNNILKERDLRRTRKKCRESFLVFIRAMMPAYDFSFFHKQYAQELQSFAVTDVKRLAINWPPQHGKSQLSTILLPCWLIGNNPDLKIVIACYSQILASRFGRSIQRMMDEPVYQAIFPDVKMSSGDDGFQKNADEIEFPGYDGSIKLVGVGSGLTGRTVDVLILDDLYKDFQTAWSPVVQEGVWDWYVSVALTRLHNDSKELQVYTRWSPRDVIGRLLEEPGNKWRVFKYPAIKVGPPTREDPREEGEALWPVRHSLEKLIESRERDPHKFESLFQQDPKPKEGLLYREFGTYESVPSYADHKAFVDTADTGSDFLCSIAYAQTKDKIYIMDVIYTQQSMEITEPEVASQFTKFSIKEAVIESNNGGTGFARNVEKICREQRNFSTSIIGFAQRANKEARILTNQSTVNNLILFPENWKSVWSRFSYDLTMYSTKGRNRNDDAPDTLTAIVERFESSSKVSNSAVLKAFH